MASNAALERQAQAREATLTASAEGPSTREARLRTLEEALALVAFERSLEHEWLEVMERQVIAAEISLASREAKVQTEIDEGIAGFCRALAKDYHKKLKL